MPLSRSLSLSGLRLECLLLNFMKCKSASCENDLWNTSNNSTPKEDMSKSCYLFQKARPAIRLLLLFAIWKRKSREQYDSLTGLFKGSVRATKQTRWKTCGFRDTVTLVEKARRLSSSITPAINSKRQSLFDEALCLNDQAGPLELRGVFCCLTMGNTRISQGKNGNYIKKIKIKVFCYKIRDVLMQYSNDWNHLKMLGMGIRCDSNDQSWKHHMRLWL